MKVAVGTTNEAKLQAVGEVFSVTFKDQAHVIIPEEVDSAITSQPMSDDETIRGAINRAEAVAKLHPDADFAVGLEGGIEVNKFGLFLKGWVAVKRLGYTAIGIGGSGAVRLPDSIAEKVKAGQELGPLMAEILGDDKSEIRHSQGTNGILTGGLYPRYREFEDALRNALGRFLASEYYD